MENIDSEKIKALLDNEELMKKLSCESATPTDYVEAFRAAGIELSEEEAAQIKEKVAQAVADPDKALKDAERVKEEELESVSGGSVSTSIIMNSVGIAGAVMSIAAYGVDNPKDRKILAATGAALMAGSDIYKFIDVMRD